jgi:hypothetical protein
MDYMWLQCADNINSTNNFILNLLSYYNTNKKTIASGGSSEGWTSNNWLNVAGTFAVDSTHYKIGSNAAQYTGTNAGGIHYVFSSSLNLNLMNDGITVSGSADFITFQVYIASLTSLNTAGITIYFENDAFNTQTNYLSYQITKANLSTGWNIIKIAKSAFTAAGTGAWAAITGISLNQTVNGGGSTVMTFSNFELIKKDPVGAFPNVFKSDVAQQGSESWYVGYSNGSLLIARDINPVGSGFSLLQSNGYNFTSPFVLSWTDSISSDGYMAGTGLYIDANNYAIFYINNNVATLSIVTAGGAPVTSTLTIKSIAVNDIITCQMERYSTILFVNISINNISYNFSGTFTPTGTGVMCRYSTPTIISDLVSLNIYIPDSFAIDSNAMSVQLPDMTRTYTKNSQYNNRASIFGKGNLEPQTIVCTTKFRSTTGGTAINAFRTTVNKWLSIPIYRDLYFYLFDTTALKLKRIKIYPETKSGENYKYIAYSDDISFSFQCETGYFESLIVTRQSFTVTGSGDQVTINNSGSMVASPVIRFIPTGFFTALAIQKFIGYGFTLLGSFQASQEITYDCKNENVYINGVQTYGLQTAGSRFDLDPGNNIIYLPNDTAGTLIIEYFEAEI